MHTLFFSAMHFLGSAILLFFLVDVFCLAEGCYIILRARAGEVSLDEVWYVVAEEDEAFGCCGVLLAPVVAGEYDVPFVVVLVGEPFDLLVRVVGVMLEVAACFYLKSYLFAFLIHENDVGVDGVVP